jgi:hypothetical protein
MNVADSAPNAPHSSSILANVPGVSGGLSCELPGGLPGELPSELPSEVPAEVLAATTMVMRTAMAPRAPSKAAIYSLSESSFVSPTTGARVAGIFESTTGAWVISLLGGTNTGARVLGLLEEDVDRTGPIVGTIVLGEIAGAMVGAPLALGV